GPAELAAGLAQLRVFGLRPGAAMTAGRIAAAARAAGLVEVEVTRCGDRVIAPALRVVAERLSRSPSAPLAHRTAARVLLWQMELLGRHRILDSLLLRAPRPCPGPGGPSGPARGPDRHAGLILSPGGSAAGPILPPGRSCRRAQGDPRARRAWARL